MTMTMTRKNGDGEVHLKKSQKDEAEMKPNRILKAELSRR